MANTLDETMTYREVADLLGVSPATVRHMVRVGTLDSTVEKLVGDANSVWEADDEVITEASHGLRVGDRVRIAIDSGATGASAGYFYVKTVPSANTFTVSTTLGGTTQAISADGVVDVYKVLTDPFSMRLSATAVETYIDGLVTAAGVS